MYFLFFILARGTYCSIHVLRVFFLSLWFFFFLLELESWRGKLEREAGEGSWRGKLENVLRYSGAAGSVE